MFIKSIYSSLVISSFLAQIILGQVPCGSTTKFLCRKTDECIDISKVCDFKKDCSDGSDELNCGSCDFERLDIETGLPSMCGWVKVPSNSTDWALRNGSEMSLYNAPKVDSSGNSSGHFLILENTIGKISAS